MRSEAMRWQVGNTALAVASTLVATSTGATQSNELREALERKPNLEHGSSLYETCTACHQSNGAGAADGDIPIIAGQHYEVIITQLVDFRRTERVDLRMNALAARHNLESSQDLADVAAYISSMPVQRTNEVGTGQFTSLGAQTYNRACVSCHGANAEGNDSATLSATCRPALRLPRQANRHDDSRHPLQLELGPLETAQEPDGPGNCRGGRLFGAPESGRQFTGELKAERARTRPSTAYHMPPRATVIASPFTAPAASLHRNAITCATSRGSRTRFCG